MKILMLLLLLLFMTAPAMAADPPRVYGTSADGRTVHEFTLNSGGVRAKFISLGGIITELHVPDNKGQTADIMLGCPDLATYEAGHPYFGCIAGRVCNRIAKGEFQLDGKVYSLAKNNGPNCLHGGAKGFDKRIWSGEYVGNDSVRLKYRSPAGEEGFPGNLDVTVTYTLTPSREWKIEYQATSDAPTPVNLTQHAYFNLAGHSAGDILGHELLVKADQYTPTDETLIPTGELKAVKGTPFDFTSPKPIGATLKAAGGNPVGFDLNYVLNVEREPLKLAARVKEPKSGRVMAVYTTEPGIQLYTGNFLDGKTKGKGGAMYQQYGGFCLECQHFPDSVNRTQFPNTILRPGQTYRQTTIYRFSAE